jgi:hypothetical protein
LGFGFDLGFTYYPKKTFKLQPVLDGYIKHSKQVETWTYKGLYKYEVNLFLMTAMTLGTYIKNLMMPFL